MSRPAGAGAISQDVIAFPGHAGRCWPLLAGARRSQVTRHLAAGVDCSVDGFGIVGAQAGDDVEALGHDDDLGRVLVARLGNPSGDLGAQLVGRAGADGVDDRLGGVDHLDRPPGQLGSEDVLAAVGGDADRPLDRRDLSPTGREHRIVGQRQAVVAELASERHQHGADGDDPDQHAAPRSCSGAADPRSAGIDATLGRRRACTLGRMSEPEAVRRDRRRSVGRVVAGGVLSWVLVLGGLRAFVVQAEHCGDPTAEELRRRRRRCGRLVRPQPARRRRLAVPLRPGHRHRSSAATTSPAMPA